MEANLTTKQLQRRDGVEREQLLLKTLPVPLLGSKGEQKRTWRPSSRKNQFRTSSHICLLWERGEGAGAGRIRAESVPAGKETQRIGREVDKHPENGRLVAGSGLFPAQILFESLRVENWFWARAADPLGPGFRVEWIWDLSALARPDWLTQKMFVVVPSLSGLDRWFRDGPSGSQVSLARALSAQPLRVAQLDKHNAKHDASYESGA